jgi:hypothetical protein
MVVKYIRPVVLGSVSSPVENYSYRGRGLSFRPSDNRHLDQYFSGKLAALVLVIDLFAPRGNIYSCTVSPMVNRIWGGSREIGKDSFFGDLGDLRRADTVLLLSEEATFSIEIKLDKEGAEHVDCVSAHFEDKHDAPAEACRLIIKPKLS